MFLYEWREGVLTPGVLITNSGPNRSDWELVLGSRSGDHYDVVPLDRRRPPYVGDNKRLMLASLLYTSVARPAWVLTDAVDFTPDAMVRIRTGWNIKRMAGEHRTIGHCRATKGNPTLITEGFGGYDRYGKPGWIDSLYILPPGAQVQIIPQHCNRTGFWTVSNDNGQPHTSRLGLPPRMAALHNRPLAFA